MVFINSGAGIHSYGDNVIYSATKHALYALADGLRIAEPAIRVSTVSPGPTDTPMLKGLQDYDPAHVIAPIEVAKAIRSALNAADVSAPGLRVVCNNNIPQSRGLGSSASAAVAGVAAGNGLAGFPLTEQQVVQLSSAFEGHPDNAAASVLGNAVVSWTTVPVDGHSLPEYKAVTVDVHKDIKATALVPNFHASTQAVRRVLPSHVTHGDATFNVSRTAVQVVALQNYPELLWEGTRDRLHQPYRADVLPVTSEWVNRLRNRGFAAYLSGAGPTAMVLHTEPIDENILRDAREASSIISLM